MSADTQASSNDSSSAAAYPSPDHKPIEKMNMSNGSVGTTSSSVVLPPIQDLPRPTSPGTSDASSTTRSPQWPQQQQQQQPQPPPLPPQQLPPHHHYSPPHHQSPAYNFPPIDHHARRPQLHINPPPEHQRVQVASYPTPTTASTMSNQSSYSSSSSSTSYHPYPNPAPSLRDHGYRPPPTSVAPPPPPPPVVTPATLAAAVGTQQRRRGKLPKPVTEFLKKWLLAHTDHPYPTEDEKKWLCSETGLSMSQVSNWMINVRHSCIFSNSLHSNPDFSFFQARRRILAPAAKNAAAAAAAQNAANVAVSSSASSAAATPYYSRSPPVRTVSGSNSDAPPTGGYPLAHGHTYHSRRESGYAPYPTASSRIANGHHHHQQQQQQAHHYSSSPATSSYPSSAPPYTGAYHFTTNSGGASASLPPPALVASYTSPSTLAPFGDSSHDGSQNGTERTKSPAGDFAYAPQ